MKSGFLFCQKTVEKEILSNVSGIMRSGFNAILGLKVQANLHLEVLATRKDPHGLSGDVLINGELPPADFKCNSGYVVQVSIHGSLCFYMSQCLELCISVLPVNYMMCL